MTQEPESLPPPTPARRPRLAWRLAAIAVIILAMIGLTHVLRRAGRVGGSGEAPPAAPPATAAAGTASPSGAAPQAQEDTPEAAPTDEKEAVGDLRKAMAGLVMAATDADEGDYEHSGNQTPEQRRQFIADRFGLPFDYPRSEAPPDVAPPGAEVLVVFQNPSRRQSRMVLLLMRRPLSEALGALQRQYETAGWQLAAPIDPRNQTDRGWMIRFRREGADRVVYVQTRADKEETLAAVYDSGY
jgi:hypothetical protein